MLEKRNNCLGVAGRKQKEQRNLLFLEHLQHRGLNDLEALSSAEAVSEHCWKLVMGVPYDTARENGPDYISTRRRSRSRRRKRDEACSNSRNTWLSIKHDARIRRRRLCLRSAYTHTLIMVGLLLLSMVSSTYATFINFENCLDRATIESDPLPLQFIPQHVWAVFDTEEDNNLNITVYGNVSGTATKERYPAPDDPQWSDPDETLGKIVDLSVDNNKYSTLITKLSVLSFTSHNKPSRFCNSVTQGECPLGPVFDANAYVKYTHIIDLFQLSTFTNSS